MTGRLQRGRQSNRRTLDSGIEADVWTRIIAMVAPDLEQAQQMPLAQRDDEGETLPPDGADRTSIGRLEYLQPETLDRPVARRPEDSVAVVDRVLKPVLERERISKLLQRPLRARMASNVKVEQAPRCMLHHDEDFGTGDERVGRGEIAELVRQAAARCNGWKVILRAQAPTPTSRLGATSLPGPSARG